MLGPMRGHFFSDRLIKSDMPGYHGFQAKVRGDALAVANSARFCSNGIGEQGDDASREGEVFMGAEGYGLYVD